MQINSCNLFAEKFSEKEYKTLLNPGMMDVHHNTLEPPGLENLCCTQDTAVLYLHYFNYKTCAVQCFIGHTLDFNTS